MTVAPGDEQILQFGAGRFLRGFVDLFVEQARCQGQEIGMVVAVQSTAGSRAEVLNRQGEGYHVAVRGITGGQVVDRVEQVHSVSRALVAATDWPEVMRLACVSELRWIISNTTEAGYAVNGTDRCEDAPPQSFPAKLTQLLWLRFRAKHSPLTILPCELIERNASKLLELVLSQALAWKLPAEFQRWVSDDCTWLNNLVDRMVIAPRSDHPLFDRDPLLIQTEPYALWAIERPRPGWEARMVHPALEVVDDLAPYYLRKVRILNGIHSALVGKYLPQGYLTVQQALREPAVLDWVLGLLYEEIVPTIAYRVPELSRFARQALDRLQNPFMEHRLADIALNHNAKVAVRLKTTRDEYRTLFSGEPKRINEALEYQPPGA